MLFTRGRFSLDSITSMRLDDIIQGGGRRSNELTIRGRHRTIAPGIAPFAEDCFYCWVLARLFCFTARAPDASPRSYSTTSQLSTSLNQSFDLTWRS